MLYKAPTGAFVVIDAPDRLLFDRGMKILLLRSWSKHRGGSRIRVSETTGLKLIKMGIAMKDKMMDQSDYVMTKGV